MREETSSWDFTSCLFLIPEVTYSQVLISFHFSYSGCWSFPLLRLVPCLLFSFSFQVILLDQWSSFPIFAFLSIITVGQLFFYLTESCSFPSVFLGYRRLSVKFLFTSHFYFLFNNILFFLAFEPTDILFLSNLSVLYCPNIFDFLYNFTFL